MYEVKPTAKYKRDLRRIAKSGYDIPLLTAAVKLLSETGILPSEYEDHALTGNWKGFRECHITSDWLLVYMINGTTLVLTLTRTGTHSIIFRK